MALLETGTDTDRPDGTEAARVNEADTLRLSASTSADLKFRLHWQSRQCEPLASQLSRHPHHDQCHSLPVLTHCIPRPLTGTGTGSGTSHTTALFLPPSTSCVSRFSALRASCNSTSFGIDAGVVLETHTPFSHLDLCCRMTLALVNTPANAVAHSHAISTRIGSTHPDQTALQVQLWIPSPALHSALCASPFYARLPCTKSSNLRLLRPAQRLSLLPWPPARPRTLDSRSRRMLRAPTCNLRAPRSLPVLSPLSSSGWIRRN
ncbi:hypothetical protein LIA77_10210 [Sarocladium implicatum]|nr:hypothetical protein LIA77_10210 [Sarocladium implicatum]